jgi:hypothetical protein
MLESGEITWEKPVPAPERSAVEAALTHPELLPTTLARVSGEKAADSTATRLVVRHLATGGARCVYLVTVQAGDGRARRFVLKRFLPVQLAHLPPGASIGGRRGHGEALDAHVLARMVWAARRIDERARGLCPRFGGFWEGRDGCGQRYRVMTEAYVEGASLERWKSILEERFVQGELDVARSTAQRLALERQAIAAYIRLWEALGRRTFTSDPSPWNVLFTPTPHGLQPAIIDLHSIHDGGTPLYVFQTLEEQFGSRDEVREHALCPGIVDALGEAEAVRFLLAVSRELASLDDLRRRHGLSSYAASRRSIARFLTSLRPPAVDPQPHTPGPWPTWSAALRDDGDNDALGV